MLSISVRDNGIGIPSKMLTSIFDMFTQVDRSYGAVAEWTRHRSDAGTAASRYARRERLRPAVMAPIEGSEFIVRLPLPIQTPDEPPPTSDGPRPTALSECRILVVDDNKDSAETLGMLLRLKGNDIRIAYDGLKAVEVAEAFRPELMLLDIGLPKLNGYEVAQRIRKEPWGRNVIIVALTGWGQEDDRRRSA